MKRLLYTRQSDSFRVETIKSCILDEGSIGINQRSRKKEFSTTDHYLLEFVCFEMSRILPQVLLYSFRSVNIGLFMQKTIFYLSLNADSKAE